MKIRSLSIGNSFSQDACAYLHDIAASCGIEWECVNLYIGGCSLEAHVKNLESDTAAYSLEINGTATGKTVSVSEALGDGEYDVITLQQASHFSGRVLTYFPYVEILAKACRTAQPNARIMLHETWSYEIDSTHGAFPYYGCSQYRMYEFLHDSYTCAAKRINADIIPVGSVIQGLRRDIPELDYANGGVSLNRDGFHLSIPVGRFVSSYVWLKAVCKADVKTAEFVPDGTDEQTAHLLEKVREYVAQYEICER